MTVCLRFFPTGRAALPRRAWPPYPTRQAGLGPGPAGLAAGTGPGGVRTPANRKREERGRARRASWPRRARGRRRHWDPWSDPRHPPSVLRPGRDSPAYRPVRVGPAPTPVPARARERRGELNLSRRDPWRLAVRGSPDGSVRSPPRAPPPPHLPPPPGSCTPAAAPPAHARRPLLVPPPLLFYRGGEATRPPARPRRPRPVDPGPSAIQTPPRVGAWPGLPGPCPGEGSGPAFGGGCVAVAAAGASTEGKGEPGAPGWVWGLGARTGQQFAWSSKAWARQHFGAYDCHL
ncbi:basic proline-rich protein-like [Meles meles]|uniref:basic proline-rich protein-like n=1 Tax=Meles meles TaxID=9662 RepID=UPI001E69AED9|nr:basic proline-rich protein-like [Meles meles]